MMVHLVFETGFLNVCLCYVCVVIQHYRITRARCTYIHVYVANQAVYIKLPACPSVIGTVCGSGKKKGVKKS